MTATPRKWEGWRLTSAGYAALGEEPPRTGVIRPRPERYQVGVEYFLTELGAAALRRPERTDIRTEPPRRRRRAGRP